MHKVNTKTKIVKLQGYNDLTMEIGELYTVKISKSAWYKNLKLTKTPTTGRYASGVIHLNTDEELHLIYLGLEGQKNYKFLFKNEIVYVERKDFHKQYKKNNITHRTLGL